MTAAGETRRKLADAIVGLRNGTVSVKEARAVVRIGKRVQREARTSLALTKAIAASDATARRMRAHLKGVKAMIECKKKGGVQ